MTNRRRREGRNRPSPGSTRTRPTTRRAPGRRPAARGPASPLGWLARNPLWAGLLAVVVVGAVVLTVTSLGGGDSGDDGGADLLYAGVHDGSRVQVQVSRDGGQSWTTP